MFDDVPAPRMRESAPLEGLRVLTPELPRGIAPERRLAAEVALLSAWMAEKGPSRYVNWFYTPMAVPLARGLSPAAVVYDCMDELSAFKGAPKELTLRERELFHLADVVFTGGHALHEAKRRQHPNVHAFPSSVDTAHFATARDIRRDPLDQALVQRPRFGFHGVIDERMDLELLDVLAALRPTYQFILLGPTAKIEDGALPRALNIHYLGQRPYEELPAYLAGWDVAIMPFAKNDATRFISPTKTPEYLAAGKAVVSTSIRDVVRTYGDRGLVRIADGPRAFAEACDAALAEADDPERIARADAFLSTTSWDATWDEMDALVEEAVAAKASRAAARVLPDAVGAE